MPAATLEAWIALYAAVGVLVALTAVLASAKSVYDLLSGGFAVGSGSWRGRLLILPRLWLLWQCNYLRGSPAILLIALLYANHIGFGVLGDV